MPSTSRRRTLNNPRHYVGGGDLDPGDPDNARTAVSSDGGVTWTLTNPPPVTGAIFGLSYVGRTGGGVGGGPGRAVVITANDGGAAWTPDEGNTWFALPGVTGFWAVAFVSPKVRLARGHGRAHSKDQFLAAVSALGLRPSHIN